MSGKWDRRQLKKAGHGRLTFSPDESSVMRRRLADRLETAPSPASQGLDQIAGR
jgi:hypothetical protein